MSRNQTRNQDLPFKRSEIEEMEKLFMEKEVGTLYQIFCQKLTEHFNLAPGRGGNRALQWEQVQKWFQNKQEYHKTKVTSPAIGSNDVALAFDSSISNNAHESSSETPKDSGEKGLEALEWKFEARSSRDGAWYDVATFTTHRVLSTGELEVRVRYEGFGAEEDEWVNVKKAVRPRSIPLESYECQKLRVGDLVLCFKESDDQATHYDGHVIEIQRKLHDIRGCRCLFLIRYLHDQAEERVPLRRLCLVPRITVDANGHLKTDDPLNFGHL